MQPAILLAPVPSPNQHPDHTAVGQICRDAARLARYGGIAELRDLPPHQITHCFGYAVTPAAEPAHDRSAFRVDISAHFERWIQLMECHQTQLRTRQYVELQTARARLLGVEAGVEYAQALFMTDDFSGRNAERSAEIHSPLLTWQTARLLKIGITCYPLIGGSGILATALGSELARRGHEVHFFSSSKPVRLDLAQPRIFFHQVVVNEYSLFRYPDYTLPLAVKMADVARREQLDIFHVHYAVPHATAAYLAVQMLRRTATPAPKIVTTLHGTDTTLLGQDPSYREAIEHALSESDAVTTVSESLRAETLADFQSQEGGRSDPELLHSFGAAAEPRVRSAANWGWRRTNSSSFIPRTCGRRNGSIFSCKPSPP